MVFDIGLAGRFGGHAAPNLLLIEMRQGFSGHGDSLRWPWSAQ